MASDPRPLKLDRDGVTMTYTRAARTVGLAIACALACLGVAAWLVLRSGRRPESVRASADPEPTSAVVDARRSEPVTPKPLMDAPAVEPPSARRTPHREPEEPTYTVLKPGEQAGLAVFPPPGTKPIKRGIVVPDDFELPEGYVRHYQTTDDGRRLPPILMFHPDYAGGNALPEDRIVPPAMAPPGLPLEVLDPDKAPASEPAASGRRR